MARRRAQQSPCRSLHRNFLPVGKDELARAALGAFTNNNDTLSYTPTVSRIPTPAPTLPLTFIKLVAKYINADLQQTTKLALESFVQEQQQARS